MSETQLEEVARQTLRELVATYGEGLFGDARRCEGLLRDFCADSRREVFVLVSALKDGVPGELMSPPRHLPLDAHVAQLSRRLQERMALAPEAAAWAVRTWAFALDIPLDALVTSPAVVEAPTIQPAPSTPDRTATAVLAWAAGVAVLWALVGGSAGTLGARWLGQPAHQVPWMQIGTLAGACLGAIAGAVLRAVGGKAGELAAWAVGGTVGGAALGAFTGAAAGAIAGIAAGEPGMAAARAGQWAASGASAGGLITTVAGAMAWRPAAGGHE